MEKLTVEVVGENYDIYLGEQVWEEARRYAKGFSQVLVVTDPTVESLYGDRLPFPKYIVPQGEGTKTPPMAFKLVEDLAERGFDRHSLLIALGGGVIGDLTGFGASIYLRGISYVQIPTTLLAQVDSSVGGKTGVNLPQGKNLMGSFHQPKRVFIDPAVLKTLPKKELSCGLGEVIKYGIIHDPEFFHFVLANLEKLYRGDHELLQEVVYRCCEIKANIVAQDELDLGVRKNLNHGHTIGHALEGLTGFQVYSHGEAVLLGMLLEARLAKELKLLPSPDFQELDLGLKKALALADLPEELPLFDQEQVLTTLLHDKKNKQGKVSFILPKRLGLVEEILLSPAELRPYLERVFNP